MHSSWRSIRFLELEDFSERNMRPCSAVYSVYSINLPPDEPSQRGLYDLHAGERTRRAHCDPSAACVTFNVQKIAKRGCIILTKIQVHADAIASLSLSLSLSLSVPFSGIRETTNSEKPTDTSDDTKSPFRNRDVSSGDFGANRSGYMAGGSIRETFRS